MILYLFVPFLIFQTQTHLNQELAELKKKNNILAHQYAEDYKRLMKLEAGYAHIKAAYADILAGPADIRAGDADT